VVTPVPAGESRSKAFRRRGSLSRSRVVAALLLLAASPTAAQEQTSSVPVVVTVGEATVQRAPDRAFVTVAVEARAKSPRDAQRQNADGMAAVQTHLAAARLPKESMRTVGYTLEQEVDFVQGKRVPRDFVARNAIEVRIDDIARVGEIVDAAVQSGASSVGDIRFDLQDRAGAERDALRLAVADARGRADAAAGGAGRTIDRVIRIEDTRDTRVVQPRPMMAAMAKGDAAQETPFQPGVIDIHARVTLTASLK
jgi:uncharacterized protein